MTSSSLLIFGASGGTGSWVLQYAQEMNLSCIAFVRKQKDADILHTIGHKAIMGNACDAHDVELACRLAGKGCTIISVIGGDKANYEGQRNIIDCAEKSGIRRMVMVTSLGCGNTWPALSERGKLAFGHSVREKSLAETWLQTSALDYCILRPGGLADGRVTGRAQCFENEEVHGYVHRSDLAAIVLHKACQKILDNCIYSVVDPGFKMLRSPEELALQDSFTLCP